MPHATNKYLHNDKNITKQCAVTSAGTSNSLKIFAASFITGRSESEPMMIPTRGAAAVGSTTVYDKNVRRREAGITSDRDIRVGD